MRAGLIVVVVLLLVAVAAQFLAADPGYVLISFQGWAVEMTIPILLALLVLLLVLAGIARRIRQAPRLVAERAAKAGARRSGRRVARGLVALAAGQLARAERLLAKAAARSRRRCCNTWRPPGWRMLRATASAATVGFAGEKAQPEARDAIFLERAELHFRAGELAAAMGYLGGILEREPRHLQALRLAIPLHLQREEWAEAARRLKPLRKHGQTAVADAAKWTVAAYCGLLGGAEDARRVQRLLGEVPRELRAENRLGLAFARALMRHGAHDLAEQDIRRRLTAEWNSELAGAYGELKPRDIAAAIGHAESWLADHPDDGSLLLALGRLCRKAQLWGKARSYLETGLSLRESRRGWIELAELLDELDEKAAADDAYRKGSRHG